MGWGHIGMRTQWAGGTQKKERKKKERSDVDQLPTEVFAAGRGNDVGHDGHRVEGIKNGHIRGPSYIMEERRKKRKKKKEEVTSISCPPKRVCCRAW